MKLAIIGLGRIGNALALHALEKGITVVAYNRTREKTTRLIAVSSKLQALTKLPDSKFIGTVKETVARHASQSLGRRVGRRQDNNLKLKTGKLGKLMPAYTIEEVIQSLASPRVIFLMVPASAPRGGATAGKQAVGPVDEVIQKLLAAGLSVGDILIDGGNSFYKDSIGRYQKLKMRGIHFLDMGTSGGIEGARYGACLMVGGDRHIYNKVQPLFKALAVKDGYGYVGPAGSGHFVKMVHNGIEYGMLQAIGEGFELLARSPYQLDLSLVARIYTHGSVIRGWLMELLHRALINDPNLSKIAGVVGGGETGRWALETAKQLKVSMPALKAALKVRQESGKKPSLTGSVIAALRQEFGGHAATRRLRHTSTPDVE